MDEHDKAVGKNMIKQWPNVESKEDIKPFRLPRLNKDREDRILNTTN